jgi:Uncharacterized protein predicted to be involved in DNA repair
MHNLDQLRAAHALREASSTDKAAVSKLPAMILSNGLLATLAFAAEPEKPLRKPMLAAVTSLARHLAQPAVGFPELAGVSSPAALADRLARENALLLQRATTEALAYLGYLKRYAPKKGSATSTRD